MANLLKMADVQSIITLHARGWSGRKIARELNIDRETVGKHLARAASDSKPATAPAGIPGASDSKPASAPAGISNPQAALIVQSSGEQSVGLSDVAPESLSRCERWRPSILVKLEAGLTAQRIYQDIVAEEGFEGENKRGHKPFFPFCFVICSRHGSQTPFCSRWPGVSCDESHLAGRGLVRG